MSKSNSKAPDKRPARSRYWISNRLKGKKLRNMVKHMRVRVNKSEPYVRPHLNKEGEMVRVETRPITKDEAETRWLKERKRPTSKTASKSSFLMNAALGK